MKTCPQCGYTDARMVLDPVSYDEIERLYTEEGLTLQEIGDRYGVTRERIRQILPGASTIARKAQRHKQALTEAFRAACQRALDSDLRCRVCDGWILRGIKQVVPPLQCSSECTQAWNVLRLFDDHEGHRRQTARTYLASPEKYKASVLEWSEAMLGPNPPPPNRRYLIPGSKRAQVIAKYRPEQYAALIGVAE